MAITLDKLGKTADGLEDAREAVRIRQEAASADPTNSWSRSSLIEAIAQTARLSARTGNAKETLEGCQRAQTLLDDKVDDPTNVSLKACRANAYGDLAEAYTFLASDENILFDQSRDRWTMARQLYQQALDMWLQLRNKGTLPGYLAGKPDEIGREIVRCDAALAAR